ncbi:MAG TPA: SPOR domain-containing protein [Sandaracinaceae bacterium LLY-WYZ-13_1]|nr:SPOR domain-containing protein [Sandaracinaceae bacterium LLY-WYZ-13_1]
MRRTLLAAGLGAAVLAALPAPASACWDGTRIQTPHLTVMGADDRWDLGRARRVAKWAPRVEALLAAAGLEAEVSYRHVTLSDGTHFTIRSPRLDGVFLALSRHLPVSRPERRAALRAPAAFTVQVAASRSRARAEALAARLNDRRHPDGPAGAHGILEVGGFPADNPTAHVAPALDADGRRVYRVIVGAFLTRAEAARVAARVRPRSGTRAFARRL